MRTAVRAIPAGLVGAFAVAAACTSAPLGAGHTSSSHAKASSSTSSSAVTSSGNGGSLGSGGGATGGGSGGAPTPASSSSSGPSSGAGGGPPSQGPVPVPKTSTTKIYVHMMPWFETPASSGMWGQHWTMANQNPDVMDATGRRQIASYSYPLIGPYASGDHDVIEYQLLLMKYAGVDGVLVDWSSTIQAWDFPRNVKNAEAIIALTAAVGLTFGVVYEDHNVALAQAQGFVTDEIAQGKADLAYLQDHYWTQPNYIQIGSAPLVLDFGPQTFTMQSDWDAILGPLSQQPFFVPLWYHSAAAGTHANAEFAWVYSDFTTGLMKFYQNHPFSLFFGVAYPGFNPFYAAGGWAGPNYQLPYNQTGTFSQTFGLAASSGALYMQLCTWNDYGEGTMIEPTREYGYSFLTTLQQELGVTFGQHEFDLINSLYNERKQYAGDAAKQAQLDQAFSDLVSLQVNAAASLL